MAPASALPIGEVRKVDETRVIRVEPSIDLMHAVLGVSHAETAQGTALLASNVAGFIFVYVIRMDGCGLVCLADRDR